MKYVIMVKTNGQWLKYATRKTEGQAKQYARALPLQYKIVPVKETL
jgi:hypothetical protein